MKNMRIDSSFHLICLVDIPEGPGPNNLAKLLHGLLMLLLLLEEFIRNPII
jgi:hypothetical protein